ncbi:CDPK-related protein kinase-like isoform X1 [Rutidosis leptorrhynchoides]|uniref:CDPK-related protein kinase-like isoform X1 n=1 Tax=Rutidosis leptorrhynchoides TaxID=125765 RepID=UPI003A99D51D
MGICSSKDGSLGKHKQDNNENAMEKSKKKNNQNVGGNKSPLYVFYAQSPTNYLFSKKSPVASPARLFKKAFAPLSPAQHMKAVLARRHGNGEEKLNKNFGFSKHIGHKYEIGEEVGKGHFGHTCKARCRKGEFKGQIVAVKIISKSKMTTAIAIEDVHREVKILRALTGHKHLINFYDAYEDHDYVYLIMELCEGGVLLERILARGGKYTEDEAKSVLIQMLTVVSFCHLQGVVHRDLKPENFLYASKDKDAELKAIDFGLSDFVCPEEKLDDIVGSAYYVAPEVLQRSYSTEADVWSVGVISYVLLCGNRPFWGRTESGIFRSVLKNEPKFDEAAWDNLSFEAKDFVKSLLNKEPRKRLTAAQALCHPWIRNDNIVKTPFDISIMKFVKRYICSSNLRKAALRALSKTLNFEDLFYFKEQFSLLEPSTNGYISIESFKTVLMNYTTDAMIESRVLEFLESLCRLQYRRMDFEEFCAAAVRVHQLEGLDRWEQQTRDAYEIFEQDGNKSIVVDELASELGLGPEIPVRDVLGDLVRQSDGNLTYLGFVKVLHGPSSRNLVTIQ